MNPTFIIEARTEFKTEKDAREHANLNPYWDEIKLHIHKHDDKQGQNEPCEIIDLKHK